MANIATLIGRSSRFSDYVPNYRFHLLDISFQLPAVLSAGFGFRFATCPEISLETKEIKEGSYEYKRSVPLSASVGDIDLHQGVQFFNSDFYDWITDSIRGKRNRRRDILMIHFSTISLLSNTGAASSPVNAFIPINDLLGFVPARAWLLKDCLPIRYKAGTDFDALGSDISLAELSIRPYQIDEFSLGF